VQRGNGDPAQRSHMSGSVEVALTAPVASGANVATKKLCGVWFVILGGRHTMTGKTCVLTLWSAHTANFTQCVYQLGNCACSERDIAESDIVCFQDALQCVRRN